MGDLIFCNMCGAVYFRKCFNLVHRHSNGLNLKYDDDVFEYLKDNPNDLIWEWADIEQTRLDFMKYCPVCKEGRYFKEVS